MFDLCCRKSVSIEVKGQEPRAAAMAMLQLWAGQSVSAVAQGVVAARPTVQ